MEGHNAFSVNEGGTLNVWDPTRALRNFDAAQVNLSRGFMRSRPEKWFPGFAAHWLPLAHSLGVEMKILEVKPTLNAPRDLQAGFLASVDDEVLAVFLDADSERVILNAVAPGSNRHASDVVLEYLARRFVTSMSLTWTGPKSNVISFIRRAEIDQFAQSAAIKLGAEINGSTCAVWLLLGKDLTERLDGLWRRQINSSAKLTDESQDLHIELANIVVPQAQLAEYLRPGAMVELDMIATDAVTLRLAGKAWLPARLCQVDGNFALEMVASPLPQANAVEGSAHLSVEFGNITMDGATLSDLTQPGATLRTGIPLSARVNICVNSVQSAQATLYVSEGSFAYRIE